jgi:hypothetical protein
MTLHAVIRDSRLVNRQRHPGVVWDPLEPGRSYKRAGRGRRDAGSNRWVGKGMCTQLRGRLSEADKALATTTLVLTSRPGARQGGHGRGTDGTLARRHLEPDCPSAPVVPRLPPVHLRTQLAKTRRASRTRSWHPHGPLVDHGQGVSDLHQLLEQTLLVDGFDRGLISAAYKCTYRRKRGG